VAQGQRWKLEAEALARVRILCLLPNSVARDRSQRKSEKLPSHEMGVRVLVRALLTQAQAQHETSDDREYESYVGSLTRISQTSAAKRAQFMSTPAVANRCRSEVQNPKTRHAPKSISVLRQAKPGHLPLNQHASPGPPTRARFRDLFSLQLGIARL
jgi:hypothetical protein